MNEHISFGGVHIPRPKDKYKLEHVGSDVAIPPVFIQDISWLPINNQRLIPACGAHAGVTLKLIQEYYDGNKTPDFSPRYLWNEIKKIDGYPLESGTDIYSILKTLYNKGVCDMSLVGNETTLPLKEYSTLVTTSRIEQNASEKKIASYATTDNPTFNQLKQAIFVNKAVIILLRVGQNMYRPSWNASDILPLNPTRYPLDGGHFMVAYAYDEKYVYFVNEWGETWCIKGTGYLGEEYVPFIKAMGTAVDIKHITPAVVPQTFMQRLTAACLKDGVIFKDGKWVYNIIK